MPRRYALTSEVALCAGLAAGAALLLAWLAPRGGDWAAHLYQRELFIGHGFTFWDNYWYAGRYAFAGYSLLYYPLAAWLGIAALAVLTVVVSATAFALVLGREWDDRAVWAGRAFAVLWAGVLLTGEFPFALGVALGLLALVALQARRDWIGALLIVAVLAASPVAFVLVAVVLIGVRPWRRVPAAALVLAGVGELVMLHLFPAGGTLGFASIEALEAIAFCVVAGALTIGVERTARLRLILGVYLLAVLATWIVPTGLGHNITRLRLLALPLVLLLAALRRWRPLPAVAAAVVLAAVWNIQPLVSQWTASSADGSRAAAVWRAPVAWLHTNLQPGSRVEAVDTSQHWPAYYLAGDGIPLARGWFRQDDFPFNALLYRKFGAAEYLRWLHSLGVAYVVVTRFPPDDTSRAEARLVPTILHRVFASPDVSIYAVRRPRSIAGTARVVALGQASVVLDVPRAGDYRIAVRWSPYWHTSAGRLSESPDGTIDLRTNGPATVQLTFSP
jgi:hypothetical protein